MQFRYVYDTNKSAPKQLDFMWYRALFSSNVIIVSSMSFVLEEEQ